MKLAVISPDMFVVSQLGLSYNMALAQKVLQYSNYEKQFLKAHSLGRFTIMDNGAAENERLTADELVDAAERILADEVIMPDALRLSDATLALTTDARMQRKIPPRYRMVVPQGDSWEEWRWCLDQMHERLMFRTIGVAKHLERLEGGRLAALKYLEQQKYHLMYDIHLLGIWNQPHFEIKQTNFPWVRGIDTGAPIAWAQAGMSMSMAGHHSLDWHKSFSEGVAQSNITIMLGWCQQEVINARQHYESIRS